MKMGDPAEVWLDAWCDICDRMPNDGRMWAPDNPFDQCVECGRGPVKYVPASEPLEERASYEAELRRKELAVAELSDGLQKAREQTESKSGICIICGTDEQGPEAEWCPFSLITKYATPEAEADHG